MLLVFPLYVIFLRYNDSLFRRKQKMRGIKSKLVSQAIKLFDLNIFLGNKIQLMKDFPCYYGSRTIFEPFPTIFILKKTISMFFKLYAIVGYTIYLVILLYSSSFTLLFHLSLLLFYFTSSFTLLYFTSSLHLLLYFTLLYSSSFTLFYFTLHLFSFQ